ncbi:MAG TPA: LptA/OstA family protein [Candidatus Acidoferrales bacterium]|nr:LptA/OstA family protein [Candidatus Acidoferrales bacterium]
MTDARIGMRLRRGLALLGAAVLVLGLMTSRVSAQEAAPPPADSMSTSPPLSTSVVPETGTTAAPGGGSIGDTIRAEPAGAPEAAAPASAPPAPAAEDDLTGDTISVTGGVPGTAPTTDTSAPLAPPSAPTSATASSAPAAPAAPATAADASPPAASAALEPAPAAASAPASTPVTTAAVPASGAIAPRMTLTAPSNEVAAPEPAAPPSDLPITEDIARAKKTPKSAGDSKDTKVASNPPQEGAFTNGLQFGNSKSPIDIKSDSMSLEYQQHSVLWTGHVHANQANAQLTSDNLRVNYLDKDFKNMKDMVADGNVRVSQGTRWATGDHGVFDQIKRTVVLTGSPVVHDGNDQITGRRITVFLDTGKSVVEGAHAVIFPHQSQEASSAAPAGAADKQ